MPREKVSQTANLEELQDGTVSWDSQDIEAALSEPAVKRGYYRRGWRKGDATAVYTTETEVWVTDSSRPYNNDARFERIYRA